MATEALQKSQAYHLNGGSRGLPLCSSHGALVLTDPPEMVSGVMEQKLGQLPSAAFIKQSQDGRLSLATL